MFNILGFKGLVDSLYNLLLQTSESLTDIKLSEDSWTLKEIIGHLIDSASNNHQRFVRLQFGDLLDFPAYNGEEWIRCQKYFNMKWKDIIIHWHSYNCILLEVIKNINTDSLQNVWIHDENAYSLEYLVNDYYKHMELHIEHFKRRVKEVSSNTFNNN